MNKLLRARLEELRDDALDGYAVMRADDGEDLRQALDLIDSLERRVDLLERLPLASRVGDRFAGTTVARLLEVS
jgi:hypothetical protein